MMDIYMNLHCSTVAPCRDEGARWVTGEVGREETDLGSFARDQLPRSELIQNLKKAGANIDNKLDLLLGQLGVDDVAMSF